MEYSSPETIETLIECAVASDAELIHVQLDQGGARVSMVSPRGRREVGVADAAAFCGSWRAHDGAPATFPAETPARGSVLVNGKSFMATAAANQHGVRVTLYPPDIPSGRAESLIALGCEPSHVRMIETILSRPQGMVAFAGSSLTDSADMIAEACRILLRQNPMREIRAIERKGVPSLQLPDGVLVTKAERLLESCEQAVEQRADVIVLQSIEPGMASFVKAAILKGVRLLVAVPGASAFDVPQYLYDMGIDYSVQAGSSFYAGVIYRKRVNQLCSACKVATRIAQFEPGLRNRLRIATRLSDDDILYVSSESGCDSCSDTHKGIGELGSCVEVLIPDPATLEFIRARDMLGAVRHWRGTADSSDRDNYHGRTSFEHGIVKLRRGVFSPQQFEFAHGPMDIQSHFADGIAQAYEFGKVMRHEEQ